MTTAAATEIPRETWTKYFNDLGKHYWGWAVTVEVLAGELGDQRRIDTLPLQGLSYDLKGSQAGDVLVEAGGANFPYEVHLIHKPRVVRASTTHPGEEIDLEIESEEGETSVIRIRPRPELPAPEKD